MQKFFSFLLLLIYTCVSTGFAVSTHYCMDKKASVELGAAHKDVCDVCGMNKTENNGCCRDEIKVVKLQQDTQLAKVLMPSVQLSLPIAFLSNYLVSPFYNFIENSITATFQPPPLLHDDIYIENRVFRI